MNGSDNRLFQRERMGHREELEGGRDKIELFIGKNKEILVENGSVLVLEKEVDIVRV
jgi:hypothetical protein